MFSRACSRWLAVMLMFSLAASASRTLNRISQPSTSLGFCASVRWTALAYGLAAAVRLAISELSWVVEIESLPTVAAAPIWTGAQAATRPPKAAATTAALTAVAVLIGVRRTARSLLMPLLLLVLRLVAPDYRIQPQ